MQTQPRWRHWLARWLDDDDTPADPLDRVLLRFSNKRGDIFTVRNAMQSVLILGKIGSGKTSGSGYAIAKSYMEAGFCGIVMCSKPGEAENWRRLAAACGRSGDIIDFTAEQNTYRFNFLGYELQRNSRAGGGLTENVVQIFDTLMDIIEGKQKQDTGDKFFDRAALNLVRNAVEILRLSQGTLTLKDIDHLIATAPESEDEAGANTGKPRVFAADTSIKPIRIRGTATAATNTTLRRPQNTGG